MKRNDPLELLRTIAEGTGWATGHEFFKTLVRCLANALETPCAFVCEFTGDQKVAHTLAYWLDGRYLDEFDYALAGTPCEGALSGEIVPYACNICDLFPGDGDLRVMRAESYLAIPLKTLTAEVVGHLAVIDRKERDWRDADFGVLRIFAARTAAEFARRRYELELQAAGTRLQQEVAIREQVELSLRASESAYREMYEDAPIVYWSTGTDGLIKRANRRAAELFGFPGAELIGKPVMSLIANTPQGKTAAQALFTRFLQGETVFDQEIEFVAHDGTPIWGSVSIKPHRDESGKIEATRSAVTNITARKLAERELEHRLELEILIATVSSRFVTITAGEFDDTTDTCLADIARAFRIDRARIFRLPDEEIAVLTNQWSSTDSSRVNVEFSRRDVPEFFDTVLSNEVLCVSRLDDLPPSFKALRRRLQDEGIVCIAIVPLANTSRIVGALVLECITTSRPWPDEDIRLLRLVGDIIAGAMARREAETALEEARVVAEAASQAKSRFLASMSHELRTPLNGILGYAQLLGRDTSLDARHAEAVSGIEHCGKHLRGLINDVLDLTRIEAGKIELEPTDVALASLLDEVADVARLRASQAGLAFIYELPDPLPRIVRLDERRLRQILLNLLGNAVKYTGEGEVCLRVTAQPAAGSSWHLCFAVQDTGIGIAEHDLDKIFEPFRQLRVERMASEGTGLGLAITRELVAAVQGTLHVSSVAGHGSLFTFELNVEEVAKGEIATIARRSTICGYEGGRRVLVVVDDKRDNRRVLCRLLHPLGFEVYEATNGAEAVETCKRVLPDLVFMDLVMPVLDGFEATRQLRQGPLSAIPIIAVSASAFDDTRRQSRATGCDDFIPKPVNLDEVLEKLERHLGLRWLYADEAVAVGDQTIQVARGDISEPPAALVTQMYDLARQGDIDGVNECLEALAQLGPAHAAFVGEMRGMAKLYDMRRIRERLRQLVETA